MTFDIQSKLIAFDTKLVDHILELSQTLPSNQHTNIGGWQHDFVSNGKSAPEWLTPITSQIENKISRLWINVNGPGHYNEWHTHGPQTVAVLYLKVPENSGDIQFRNNSEILSITPKPGQFLIFPGTLEHCVTENKSNEFRITIAVNLK